MGLISSRLSLPGWTGQSSIHGRCLLDRPVKPGDDTGRVNLSLRSSLHYSETARNIKDMVQLAQTRYGPDRRKTVAFAGHGPLAGVAGRLFGVGAGQNTRPG